MPFQLSTELKKLNPNLVSFRLEVGRSLGIWFRMPWQALLAGHAAAAGHVGTLGQWLCRTKAVTYTTTTTTTTAVTINGVGDPSDDRAWVGKPRQRQHRARARTRC